MAIVFPREQHTNWQSNIKLSALKIYIFLHVATNIEKRGHEFEREKGRVYGKVGREEGEVGNDVIML